MNEAAPDPENLFRALVKKVVATNRSLCRDLKEEFERGNQPDIYSSPILSAFQQESAVLLKELSSSDRQALAAFVQARYQSKPIPISQAVVAEIMRRAQIAIRR